MKYVISVLDFIFEKIFISEKIIKQEAELIKRAAKLRNEDLSKYSWYILDILDSKAAALLTHVSMMIGVLSIVGALLVNTKIEKNLIFIEIGIYVFIAVCLLRCIRILGYGQWLDENIDNNGIFKEVSFRRQVYVFCLNLTVIVTVFFLLTMISFFLIE